MNERLPDRLAELAALSVVEGLDAAEARELAAAGDAAARTAAVFERAAASVFVAAAPATGAPPPSGLVDRLERQATAFLPPAPGERASEVSAPRRSPLRLVAASGWLAAAAAFVAVVVLSARLAESRGPFAGDPAAARERMLTAVADASVVSFSPSDHRLATGARGDVVWSDDENAGFLRFEGLAPNDPSRAQYQLWIFRDPELEPHPVDGGVFDVGSSGEVVVPIDAKLDVGRAAVFAVTLEEPGGVVVSDRSELVLVGARAL